MAWRASLLVALAACGDNLAPPPPPDGIESGTRLRARFLEDGEGAREFEGFHDLELGADCAFQGDPARCLPEVAYVRGYRDAACTVPLYSRGIAGECTALPEFVGLARADGCPGDDDLERIWRRGERIALDIVYAIEGGACVGSAPRSDTEYYGLGAEILAEGFVAATGEVTGEGRLRQLALVGDDGSRLPVGFHDEVLDLDCGHDQELGVCVPDFVLQNLWSDYVCAYPIAGSYSTECAGARFAGRYRADGRLALFERGAEFTPNVVYVGDGATSCDWTVADPAVTYYLAGPDLAGELAGTERFTADDYRRLQAYYVGDGDARLRVDGFHDRERGVDCEPVATGPERWHCLPPMGVPATRFFADSLCEQPIDVFEERPGDPPGSPEKPRRGLVWRPSADSPCESHAHLYQRGAEIPSGSLYEPRLLGCQRLTWSTDEVRRFALGPALPLDEYAELGRVSR